MGSGWGGRRVMGMRATWRARVEAGGIDCARCGLPIAPGAAWDLGHLVDRARGGRDSDGVLPEHARCNRSAGGRLAHAMTRQVRVTPPASGSTRRWDVP